MNFVRYNKEIHITIVLQRRRKPAPHAVQQAGYLVNPHMVHVGIFYTPRAQANVIGNLKRMQ